MGYWYKYAISFTNQQYNPSEYWINRVYHSHWLSAEPCPSYLDPLRDPDPEDS